MKVLVTGATGFIGNHVINKLLKCGYECVALARHKPENILKGVTFIQGDVAKSDTLKGKINDVEGVIHLAGREDILMEQGDNFGDRMFEVNVIGIKNLLNSLKLKKIKRIIVVTSCMVNGYYGDGRLANEDDCFNLTSFESPYIWSRYQTEKLCLEFASQGWPIVLIEPTFVVGSNDSRPNFPGKMILEFLKGRTKIVPKGGSNWISVSDVSQGIVHFLESKPHYVRYLFGDENMTFQKFYKIVAKISGLGVSKVFIPYKLAKPVGSLSDWLLSVYGKNPGIPLKNIAKISNEFLYFNCSRAKTEGCYQGGNVESAIKEAVKWFRSKGRI